MSELKSEMTLFRQLRLFADPPWTRMPTSGLAHILMTLTLSRYSAPNATVKKYASPALLILGLTGAGDGDGAAEVTAGAAEEGDPAEATGVPLGRRLAGDQGEVGGEQHRRHAAKPVAGGTAVHAASEVVRGVVMIGMLAGPGTAVDAAAGGHRKLLR
nr:hypothetical protein GCM10020092_039570 [Actinoplanes digitatis]